MMSFSIRQRSKLNPHSTKLLNVIIKKLANWKKHLDSYLQQPKSKKQTEFKYNACQLKEARKNIIETVDHILNNDLIQEYPAAAKYVAEIL